MLKFIILLIFATTITMPLQSVDGNSCADGYMIDPDHDSSDPSNYGFMGKCVPNPDYNPPLINDEALLQALDTIDDLLDTIGELESTATEESSTSILDNPTILILLILVIVILIIVIRRNLGNGNI